MLYSELAPSLNSNNISEAEQLTQLRSAIFQICEQLDVEMPQASEGSTSTSSVVTTSDTFESLNVVGDAYVGGTLTFAGLSYDGDYSVANLAEIGDETRIAGGYVDMKGWVFVNITLNKGSGMYNFYGFPKPRESVALACVNTSSLGAINVLMEQDPSHSGYGRLAVIGGNAGDTIVVSGWYRR